MGLNLCDRKELFLALLKLILGCVAITLCLFLVESNACASDATALLDQVGTLRVKRHLGAIATIEICPGSACEYFEFGIPAPEDKAIDLVLLHMYFVSAPDESVEKWRKDVKVTQRIDSLLKTHLSNRCRPLYKLCQRSGAFCYMASLIKKFNVKYFLVWYRDHQRDQKSYVDQLGPWCELSGNQAVNESNAHMK